MCTGGALLDVGQGVPLPDSWEKPFCAPAAFFFLRQPEGLGWLTVAALSVKAESNLPSFSPRLVVTDSPYIEGG